jgi:hypothetical protein
MSPLDEKQDDWQQRVARFRRFAALLGEDEATAPLRALAREMERRLLERYALGARYEELKRIGDVLIAEIDVVFAWARSSLVRAPGFTAADLREESRLCREEASAALDETTRRAFAKRALDLAMLGEEITRDKDS